MRTGRPRAKRVVAIRPQRGYALLALIFALMIMAIMMTAAVPDAITQGKRERELEAIFRGQQMAEAIARYYAGNSNRIGPAGLVVKTPPPPYGYLTELKKLRDGVTVGNDDVYFVRASAMIDPLSNDEWDPIRVGDPRLKKFFRAWQESTGRQLPPIYASYMGASANTLDTSEHPTDENGNPVDENGDSTSDDPEAEGDDDGDDEEDDEEDDEDDGDEGDDDDSSLRNPSAEPLFVKAAFQSGGFGNSSSNTNSGTIGGSTRGTSNSNRGGFKDPGFVFGKGTESKTGPIIGVISKKKGKSVIAYFGITNYEEMLFIFMPEPQAIVSQPVQPQQQQNGQQGTGNDLNGDGIPDDVKPNAPTTQQNP